MQSMTALLFIVLLSPAMPAVAAGDSTALDLNLPEQPMFTAASPHQDDPPGTYYGDTATNPASVARPEQGCPIAADGSDRSVTGSVTSGVGYSSHGGSSTFNAANLNFCKGFADDQGNVRTLNVNVDLQEYDGPGNDRGRGHSRAWGRHPASRR